MAEYKVQFEVFEGPLDLLLHLVRKEEVDIYQVNLTRLATQFIEYVELMRQLDLDVASEFLVMAATLMYIKSRELLPVDRQIRDDATEEDDSEDPRWELIRKLVEYKKYKDAAARLETLEDRQHRVFLRTPPRLRFDSPPPALEVSLFDLLGAVNVILQRFQAQHRTEIIADDPWTVSGKIESLRQLLDQQPCLRFSTLFSTATSRNEIVATFLALLELIRLRHVSAVQATAFEEIEIRLTPPESLAAGTPVLPDDSGQVEPPATDPATDPDPSP